MFVVWSCHIYKYLVEKKLSFINNLDLKRIWFAINRKNSYLKKVTTNNARMRSKYKSSLKNFKIYFKI